MPCQRYGSGIYRQQPAQWLACHRKPCVCVVVEHTHSPHQERASISQPPFAWPPSPLRCAAAGVGVAGCSWRVVKAVLDGAVRLAWQPCWSGVTVRLPTYNDVRSVMLWFQKQEQEHLKNLLVTACYLSSEHSKLYTIGCLKDNPIEHLQQVLQQYLLPDYRVICLGDLNATLGQASDLDEESYHLLIFCKLTTDLTESSYSMGTRIS